MMSRKRFLAGFVVLTALLAGAVAAEVPAAAATSAQATFWGDGSSVAESKTWRFSEAAGDGISATFSSVNNVTQAFGELCTALALVARWP